jgi:radical SAM superfamily enzyme YgiQ (UPF0313 family)
MKITLISPYSSLASLGVRSISASLKKAGHAVTMLFLTSSPFSRLSYSGELLDRITELCRDSGLIGISLMSGNFSQAERITSTLKSRLHAPVIWGGIHPTSRPEECLQVADIVCIGEGEGTIVELAARMETGADYSDVRNLWLTIEGKIRKNDLRPLIQDLDSLPFMDYDLDGHHIFTEGDLLVPMTKGILHERLALEHTLVPGTGVYQTIWTRGCPYHCSYCCNDIFHTLYKGQRIVRKRKASSIIDEIHKIKNEFDFISNVCFHDDSFFAVSTDDLKEFCDLYRKKIDMPFVCLGDPQLTSEEKLKLVVDAGLRSIQVGIESGSEKTIALYRRSHFNSRNMLKLAEIINKFMPRLSVHYDLIVDNPYETDEDLLETIRMLLNIPYPYNVQLFSLTFFPGTALHRKADADGLLGDEKEEAENYENYYGRIKPTYLNFALKLLSLNVSKSVVRFMIHPRMLAIFNRKWFGALLFMPSKGAKRTFHAIRKIKKR